MKYDTTPLSIDTAGVDLPSSPEDPVRFVPADDLNRSFATGEISQPTIVAGSVGFDTFIEPPRKFQKLEVMKERLVSPRFRSWSLIALLASASAFAGGLAVYWVGSSSSLHTATEPSPAANQPQTEIRSAETFVSKAAADSAAAESPAVQTPAAVETRQRRNVTQIVENSNSSPQTANPAESNQPLASAAANASEPQSTSETVPEARVGGYVVERPNGRKPLARCADGTYSYSASRSAACAGRGGVGEWIGEGKPVPSTPVRQAAYVLGPRGGCYYLDGSNKKIYVEKKYCEQ